MTDLLVQKAIDREITHLTSKNPPKVPRWAWYFAQHHKVAHSHQWWSRESGSPYHSLCGLFSTHLIPAKKTATSVRCKTCLKLSRKPV